MRAALVALVASRALPYDRVLVGEVVRDTEKRSEHYLARIEAFTVQGSGTLGDTCAALKAIAELAGTLYLAEAVTEIRRYFWQ